MSKFPTRNRSIVKSKLLYITEDSFGVIGGNDNGENINASLENLSDVDFMNPLENNNVLQYDLNEQKWVNRVLETGNLLETLTDVKFTPLENNNILQYDSNEQKWINTVLTLDKSIESLTDTTITDTPLLGQLLTYDGTAWKNGVVNDNNSINIGPGAGSFPPERSHLSTLPGAVSIGSNAGYNTYGFGYSVSIGHEAGNGQKEHSIAIGTNTGAGGKRSIAIGNFAGNTNHGENAVAIGFDAGRIFQKVNSVAIGVRAGCNDQASECVAIGNSAGLTGQEIGAVAIGFAAGRTDQGEGSVCVGRGAGRDSEGNYNITLGHNCGSTADNSIVLNASSVTLERSTTGFFVSPETIQRADLGLGVGVLHFDIATGEIKVSTT